MNIQHDIDDALSSVLFKGTGQVKNLTPRTRKTEEERRRRIKNNAEVFTPSWLCNGQNNLIDDAWFGYKGAFATSAKVEFPENKSWRDYVRLNRMEIACGEAPYLTGRYDAVSGEPVAVSGRAGLLDRKLRVISENAQSAEEWREWARVAYKSVYGFDMQGDNVAISRLNLLLAYTEAYENKFKSKPDVGSLLEIAGILAKNIVCADGLKGLPFAGVEFNAIVGNPPYQIKDGGAQSSAMPVYNAFVDAAKSTGAQYISMIIPARWYAGGKGLDAFRRAMLQDKKMAVLVDYADSADCFPSLGARNIKGGVCYFLRDSGHGGKCLVKTMSGGKCVHSCLRDLGEGDVFIRDGVGADILKKVSKLGEKSFAGIVSSRKPFGLATDFRDFVGEDFGDCYKIYAYKKTGFVAKNKILRNRGWAESYKLFVPEAVGVADAATDKVKPVFGEKGACCTETYLVVGPFADGRTAKNCAAYIGTKFFHFLLSLKKISQHTTKKCYEFIPLQDFSERWDDKKLYEKYGLTAEETEYIERTVWAQKRGK